MGTWWWDQFRPFGCHTSPAIFDPFASDLELILQIQWGWEHTLHYIDYFLAIFPHSTTFSDAPNRFNGDFSQICRYLGFRVKDEKNEEGYCIRFLGIEINTEAMVARLPHHKHKKAMALVNSTLAQHSVIHRSLETTVGFLSFAMKVVPASHPFLRRLYDTLSDIANSPHQSLVGDQERRLLVADVPSTMEQNPTPTPPVVNATAMDRRIWTDRNRGLFSQTRRNSVEHTHTSPALQYH